MEQQPPNDADLVASTLAGNCEAYAQLYDRHARMVRAVVLGISGDWSAVEDLVQEAFLRGFRNVTKLRDPQKFGRWIVGIARQVACERRRSLRRDRHEFLATIVDEIESSADVTTDALDHEQIVLMMQKLAALPERERLAIHAFFLEQRNARDAAEMMNLSRSGFYALLQRAIARLASQLMTCDQRVRGN